MVNTVSNMLRLVIILLVSSLLSQLSYSQPARSVSVSSWVLNDDWLFAPVAGLPADASVHPWLLWGPPSLPRGEDQGATGGFQAPSWPVWQPWASHPGMRRKIPNDTKNTPSCINGKINVDFPWLMLLLVYGQFSTLQSVVTEVCKNWFPRWWCKFCWLWVEKGSYKHKTLLSPLVFLCIVSRFS